MAVQRLAILPLDHLGSDGSLDWAGSAAATALAYDLTGARNLYAQVLSSLALAPSMQASRAIEGYFVERNGKLEIHATVEDLQTSKALESVIVSGPAADGIAPLVDQLARSLSPEARPLGTSNAQAFRLWGEALASSDREKLVTGLMAAAQADPQFVAAKVDLAEFAAAAGNRDRARQMLEEAERMKPGPVDQAQLAYVSASLSGNGDERLKALSVLAQRNPANAALFRELAQMLVDRRDFQGGAREYREAARLNPKDPALWNALGYALAYGQDLAGARQALEQYRRLDPEGSNPWDSLGEVSFYLGDFDGAYRYFLEAAKKNPAELVKAAEARLMTGDRPGADALFDKQLERSRGRGNLANYQKAQWEYLSGRPTAGMERMEKLAQESNGDLQALALGQLSIWKLDTGEPKAAADLANEAAMHAQSPQTRGISAMCRAIATGLTGSGSRLTDALALLLANKLQEALPLLEAAYRETNPSTDGQVRTLLAWAYVKTGAVDKAAPLVVTYPLPLSSGDPLVASLVLRLYSFARGSVLQREGKREEASKSFDLYKLLQGRDQFSAAK